MKTRRKRWSKGRRPKDPQAAARQVWIAAYPGEPWPRGWHVQWVGFMRGALGLCLWDERRILLSWADANRNRDGYGVLGTLLHEFVHVRCPDLRHGPEFCALENAARVRVGLPEKTHWRRG